MIAWEVLDRWAYHALGIIGVIVIVADRYLMRRWAR